MIGSSSTNFPAIVGFLQLLDFTTINQVVYFLPLLSKSWVFVDLVDPHTVIILGYLSEFD
jgi:hypothetical protein